MSIVKAVQDLVNENKSLTWEVKQLKTILYRVINNNHDKALTEDEKKLIEKSDIYYDNKTESKISLIPKDISEIG